MKSFKEYKAENNIKLEESEEMKYSHVTSVDSSGYKTIVYKKNGKEIYPITYHPNLVDEKKLLDFIKN